MLTTQHTLRREPTAFFTGQASEPSDVLRLAFEGAPHGIVVSAADGAIVFANSVACSVFGYTSGQMIGLPIARLLPASANSEHADDWTSFLRNPQSRATIAACTVAGIRRDGGMVPLEIGLNVVADGAARWTIVSLVDVTERLQVEERLAAAANAHLE